LTNAAVTATETLLRRDRLIVVSCLILICLPSWYYLAAGGYQLSPLKRVCLVNCRTPASFLAGRWPQGRLGAWHMGWLHGIYCVGCCWFLMLLLFVGGIMNLVWIAGLAVLVLLEKLLPARVPVAQISAVPMLLGGVYLIAAL
jgi:predicted metal-binding membrane protein